MVVRTRLQNNAGNWPLDLNEVKNYCRVGESFTADDSLFQELIKQACNYAQGFSGQQINSSITAKVIAEQSHVKSSQGKRIALNYPNSTITITSVNQDGTALESTDYELKADNTLELVSFPAEGVIIVVEYTAAISFKVEANGAILKLVADAYENRTEQGIEPLSYVKQNAKSYLMALANGSSLF